MGLVLLAAGCQSFGGKKKTPTDTATAAPAAAAGGTSGVQPAGYQPATGGPYPQGVNSPPGSRLDAPDLPAEETAAPPKTFTERVKRDWQRVTNTDPNPQLARELFREAEALFKEKKYSQAASRYKAAAARWPGSALEEDGLFMHAECWFFADQYSKASEAYGKLLEKYENSRHLDTILARQFAIAQYWFGVANAKGLRWYHAALFDRTRPFLDTHGRALKTYEHIHLKDPTGPLADDALLALGGANFARRYYEDADYYFTELYKSHPDSKHAPTAQVLSIQSKLLKYQGPHYDGAALEEADQAVNELLRQYPGEIPGHPGEREKLLAARAEIRARLAERVFMVGEYYRRRKQYRAARFYYNELLNHYGDTPLAEEAQSRFAEIRDLEDPPERFVWLDKIFPDSHKDPLPANLGNNPADASQQP